MPTSDEGSGADPGSYDTSDADSAHNAGHRRAPHQLPSDGPSNPLFTVGTAQNHQFPAAELSVVAGN